MIKRTLAISILCMLSLSTHAQHFFIEADFVSKYMWRGLKCGNAAVQPTIGMEWGGLTLSAWGSTQFKDKNNEVNFTLTYEYEHLMLFFNNMYAQNDDEESKFFNYSPRTTGHTFDLGLIYTVSEIMPLSLAWYTIVAGNDYKENDKRAWSTYIEFNYPFRAAGVDFELETGITPWKGVYGDKFDVTNIALKGTKEIPLTKKIAPSVFAQMGANPNDKDVYFVVGVTL